MAAWVSPWPASCSPSTSSGSLPSACFQRNSPTCTSEQARRCSGREGSSALRSWQDGESQMPPHGTDSLVLAALGLLAVPSLGLKAAAGPPHDGLMDIGAGRFETLASKTLERQH